MSTVVMALKQARTLDPHADTMGPGAQDCLLIDATRADELVAMIPGAYRDDNDPPTTHTRVVLPEFHERSVVRYKGAEWEVWSWNGTDLNIERNGVRDTVHIDRVGVIR